MQYTVHNPNNLPLVDYRNLSPLQGELKVLDQESYDKLRASIEENGFFVPVFTWQYEDPEAGSVLYIMDGHQRQSVLENEEATSTDEANPYGIPALVIEADTLVEAKQKLLLITSQFGIITDTGLATFTADLDRSWVDRLTSFAGIFKPLDALVKRDLLPNDTDPADDDGAALSRGKRNTPSDDNFSMFELVMEEDNRQQLLVVINHVKEQQSFDKIEDALMHLVKHYAADFPDLLP